MKIGPLTIARTSALAAGSPEETDSRRRTIARGELGSTGTRFLSGILYTEEYNSDLQGDRGIDTYTKMAKSDPTVRAVERAVTLPIRAALWSVEPASDDARDREIAEFVDHNLHAMRSTWDSNLRQVLYMLRYGRYLFEKVYAEESGRYVWDKWAPRLPKTVYRWYFEQNGDLAGIRQRAWKLTEQGSGMGVIPVGTYEYIDIEAARLLVFVNDMEGSNYEGESLFRPMYKPWWFKENLERILAIGAERREIGTEFAHMKDGATKDQTDAVAAALASLHAHEQGYIIFPPEVEEGPNGKGIFGMGTRQASPTLQLVEYFKREIATSALAEFLAMGSNANGTQAMHRDKTSFFLLALRAISDNICEVVDRDAIKQLVDVNFGPQEEYPHLKATRLETRNVQEYAKAILDLSNAGALTPDRVIEEAIRHEMDLPDMPEEDDTEADEREQRRNPQPPPMPGQPPEGDDDPDGDNPEQGARRRAMNHRRHWRGVDLQQRERRPTEKHIDLAALENRLNRGQRRIVRAAQDVQERQIDKLVEIATGIVEADAAARVERIEVPYGSQMANAILGELQDLYAFGIEEVRKEVTRDGRRTGRDNVLEAEPEKVLEFLRSRARSIAAILAAKLKSAFAAETLQQVKQGVADPERLRTRLTEISTRDLEAQARASTSEALNFGRQSAFEALEDDIKYVEYSCLLDSNSCGPCSERDGQQYQIGTAEYYLNRPPLTECSGMGNCRCIYVAVFKDEVEGA